MEYLDTLPIWAVFAGLVILVLVTAEIGFRAGIWLQDRGSEVGENRMTSSVVGGMLSLLGLLMAFSIGITIGHHGERKAMVVTEANAINTAWLRSGFLDEPDSVLMRKLLREYTEVRLEAANQQIELPVAMTHSEEIHKKLWAVVENNVRQGNDTDIMTSLVESVNNVINTHNRRLTAATKRLPRILGITLLAATLLSFLLVGVASSADRKRDTAAILIFALAFIAVQMIMVDLDRPHEGMLTVSQTAMTDLLRQITPVNQ